MTYRIVQKNGKNSYLYEVESVWDAEKKKPKQYRRYLGKCDADGNLLTPPKRGNAPEITKTFGSYYALLELADMSGIYKNMVDTMGEEDADLAVTMAILRVIRPGPLRQILNQIDESFIPELLKMKRPTLSDLSSLLTNIGESEPMRNKLTSLRSKGDSATIFDVIYNDVTENRDSYFYCAECRTATIPKKNLFVAYSDTNELPFTIRLCSSNMTDIGSIRRMNVQMKELGMTRVEFVLSSMSYNPLNIMDMIDSRIDFTMIIPVYAPAAKELLSKASETFFKQDATVDYNGYSIKCFESELGIGGRRMRAIVLEEEDRRYQEMVNLNKRMSDFESFVQGMRWYDGTINDLRRSPYADMIPLFFISEGTDGGVAIERWHERILEARDRCGKLIIITTSDVPWTDVLAKCKKRDRVNSQYTVLSDDVEGRAKFIPTTEASVGVLGIELVSLMIREELLKRLRKNEETRKMWSHDFISEMGKLKITRMGGKWKVNEMSERQKHLLDLLGIHQPYLEYD